MSDTPPPATHQEGLDPKVKAMKQAELQVLQQQMAQHQAQERERKYAVRYHKVAGWLVPGGRVHDYRYCY